MTPLWFTSTDKHLEMSLKQCNTKALTECAKLCGSYNHRNKSKVDIISRIVREFSHVVETMKVSSLSDIAFYAETSKIKELIQQ